MFEEGTLSDCLIKVGDETIKAHRCILAQNSKVFLRMFEQKGMKEAQKGEIKIVDSSPECFRAMIEYFYSGEITKINFEKLVDDLYVIAHKYEVLTLMDKCESFMSLNIDAANFTKRCHYAGLYGLPMLEKACIKYIFDNKNFLISNEWNEFKIANSTLAFRLLESVVGDETIKAHRCILAQNSKVFLRMFEQKGMKEAQKGEIKIVDSSPECFRAMIEYFYSGEITKINFEKLVDDLYVIAHKYEVLTLMDKCESFMSLNIDATNFTKRCHYAELYNLPLLKNACIKSISANRNNFLISNEWNEFKGNNSPMAIQLLESALKNSTSALC
uniref:BTB domain-containing protein n=1 Tax=Meloidogyne hapla TaxID=6305 RepID=A0A1I8BL90_MELHA